ncbi:MAG: hypothetical protein OXN79_11670 [bacterium]|nr:hypothetical protein [bacterium]MDE0217219.1 hypothetical protein [bacterium]
MLGSAMHSGCLDEVASGARAGAGGLIESDTDHLTAVLGHEVAYNTVKNYSTQGKKFSVWAARRGVVALPAAPAQVAAYLAERLQRHGHKPATLRVAAAAIGFAHRSADLLNPLRQSPGQTDPQGTLQANQVGGSLQEIR